MSKKIWSLIFKSPAIILLIASFLAGTYAAIYEIQGMSWEVPITLGVVIFLYYIGSNIENRYYKELKEKISEKNSEKNSKEQEDIEDEEDEDIDDEEDDEEEDEEDEEDEEEDIEIEEEYEEEKENIF